MNAPSMLQICQALTTYAGTASFVLEGPLGVLTSAVISSVSQLIFGSIGSQDAATTAILNQLQQDEKTELVTSIQGLQGKVTYAMNSVEALSTAVSNLTSPDGQPPTRQELMNKASATITDGLKQLDSATGLKSDLGEAIATLNSMTYLDWDQKSWDTFMMAWGTLVNGVATFLLMERLRVQYQSILAVNDDFYTRWSDFRWWAAYWCGPAATLDANSNIVVQPPNPGPVMLGGAAVPDGAEPWFGQLPTWVAQFKYWRMLMIQPVRQGPSTTTGPYPVTTPGLWMWLDYGDGGNWHNYDTQDEANAAHDAQVQKVQGQIDSAWQPVLDACAGWRSCIANWQAAMPPLPPLQPPTVSPSGQNWQGTTPGQNPGWVDGNSVAYAVEFANSLGTSPLGPWSAPVPIAGRTCPLLTFVPQDTSKVATARKIWRRFVINGFADQPEEIGVVGTGATTFQDTSN